MKEFIEEKVIEIIIYIICCRFIVLHCNNPYLIFAYGALAYPVVEWYSLKVIYKVLNYIERIRRNV